MLNKMQTLKSLELENRRRPVGIKSINFGVPMRGLLKFQVPVQILTHTGFGSSQSCLQSGGVMASDLPPKRWDLCLKVIEMNTAESQKCPGFPCTLTAKLKALSICRFFLVSF